MFGRITLTPTPVSSTGQALSRDGRGGRTHRRGFLCIAVCVQGRVVVRADGLGGIVVHVGVVVVVGIVVWLCGPVVFGIGVLGVFGDLSEAGVAGLFFAVGVIAVATEQLVGL